MKKLILFFSVLIFLSSCFEPEIPGTASKSTNKTGAIPAKGVQPGSKRSNGSVSNGTYTLETIEKVDFDQIQIFPYFKEKRGGETTGEYTHIFRFNTDNTLDLEMIKKSNSQSFQSKYKPEGEWSKRILLDKDNRFYYIYSREYSLSNVTIEASQTSTTLEVVVKNGNIIGCVFNNSDFFKSKSVPE